MAAPRRLRRVAEHVGPASVAAGLSFPRTEAYQSVELTAAQARRLRSDPHSEGHDALARLAAGEIPAVIVRSAHGDCAHALRQLAPLYPAEWVANWLDLGSGPEADGLRADATALRGAHAPALDAERARYESYIIGGPNRDPRCAEAFNYPYFPRFFSIFSRFPLDFWLCSLDSWRPDAENGRIMGENG
eukprot:COSAG04_NODE_38_length_33641_cov_13.222527_19_plen_189_part_00